MNCQKKSYHADSIKVEKGYLNVITLSNLLGLLFIQLASRRIHLHILTKQIKTGRYKQTESTMEGNNVSQSQGLRQRLVYL